MTEEKSKYEQALDLYETKINDDEVKAKVARLIEEKVPENDTPEVKRFLMGSVELTTLKTTDSEESVLAFTEKVNQFEDAYPTLPHVATICVYPCYASIVSQSLEVEGVEVACVSGSFPSSQAVMEVKTVETALALRDGATEIDIVMSVGKFLSGDYETVCDEISELKAICGKKKMKVILETGLLGSAENIKKASILAMSRVLGVGHEENWLCHMLEHAVSAKYNIAHGAGMTAILPAYLRFIAPQDDAGKLDALKKLFGAEDAAAGLEAFFRRMGLPVNLTEALGFTPDEAVVRELAQNALPWGDMAAGGYAPFTLEDAITVLSEACK